MRLFTTRLSRERGVLLLWVLTAPQAGLAAPQLFGQLNSINYSEPVSVGDAFTEADGPFTRGSRAFTHSEAQLGMQWQGWRLSVFSRFDYDLKFHSDTAELAFRDHNQLPVELERTYQLRLKVNRVSAQGVKVGYEFPLSEALQVGGALAYLQTSRLQQGALHGQLTPTNDNKYSGALDLAYVYDRDRLLDRPDVAAPSGVGLALDLNLCWEPTANLQLATEFQDLLSRIRWRNAPYSTISVTSETLTINEQGLIETKPSLSATESYRTHYQTLPIRSESWLDWRWQADTRMAVGVYQHDELLFPRLRLRVETSGLLWQLQWDIKTQALGLGLGGPWVQVALLSDSMDLNRAHIFGLKLAVQIPLP